jgi:uncharacterized protein with PIN domain
MAKKRVALRLADDEVAVVGPIERWEHLIIVYECFAEDPEYAEEADTWHEAADWVRAALKAAQPKDKYVEEDEW